MTNKDFEPIRARIMEEAYDLADKNDVEGYNAIKVMCGDIQSMLSHAAQQDPVTWGVDWGKAGDIPCVSIIKRLPDGSIQVIAVEYAPYSYTTPAAQRPWIGLTVEEKVLGLMFDAEGRILDYDQYADAIEAKLKDKNNG